MSFKIMPKAVLSDWIKRLQRSYRVVGPVERHGSFVFDELTNPEELQLVYPPTVLPPKKYIVPPRETLVNYRLDGTHIAASIEAQPTVILGLHTCDLHGITLLDKIFNMGFDDQHYQARRENTYLVSIECLETCTDDSFCRDVGTASASRGFDLHFIDLDDVYAVNMATRKGEKLLEGFHHAFDALPSDMKRVNSRLSEKWQKFAYRLDFDIYMLPELLEKSYDSELWNELGEICLACGMCTQVCPTCYCFDVKDEANLALDEGHRVRRWDSCQIHQFAMVAGGHNFREELAARQRHRYMRKGKYQKDAIGMVGCTGCGRCASSCLVHIAPIDVFNELYARAQAKEAAELVTGGVAA
jgi:sulfhydrogenase subunit beta (sulfur reductase)